MKRCSFICFLAIFLFQCNPQDQVKQQERKELLSGEEETNADTVVLYNDFDSAINVQFVNTVGAPDSCQSRVLAAFMDMPQALATEIMDSIFEFYKRSYPDYRIGYEMGDISERDIEEMLPTPESPEKLRKHLIPGSVYIPSPQYCKENFFGVYFDCTWDFEHGVGVLVKNGKVVEAGIAQIAFMNID